MLLSQLGAAQEVMVAEDKPNLTSFKSTTLHGMNLYEIPEISPSAKAYPPKNCFRFRMDLHFCSAKVPRNIKHLSLRTSDYTAYSGAFSLEFWETWEQS